MQLKFGQNKGLYITWEHASRWDIKRHWKLVEIFWIQEIMYITELSSKWHSSGLNEKKICELNETKLEFKLTLKKKRNKLEPKKEKKTKKRI